MSTNPCARCGTAIAAGEHLCWRCKQELPVERPTRVAASGEGSPQPSAPPRQLWRGQPVPPGMVLPSRTQYHGTMYALIALGVAVTLTLAVLINKGVGPFVVSGVHAHERTATTAASATGSVTNEGDRTGRARCVALWTNLNGGPQQSPVVLTTEIQPGQTAEVTVPLAGVFGPPPGVTIDCR